MSVAVPVIDSINGVTRKIFLKQGVSEFFPIEDIYHEYRRRRSLDIDSIRKFEPFLRAEGNIAKGGGKFTPRYVVLLLGTKIVPYDESSRLDQLGEIITDDPDVDATIYDVSGLTTGKAIFLQPSEAEIIELAVGSGLSATEQERLLRIYQALMLDVNSPVVNTPTKISFDDVEIDLTGDPDTEVTGTRKP